MRTTRSSWIGVMAVLVLAGSPAVASGAADGPAFRVGSAEADITPPAGHPDVGLRGAPRYALRRGRSTRSWPRRS